MASFECLMMLFSVLFSQLCANQINLQFYELPAPGSLFLKPLSERMLCATKKT